MGVPPSSVRRSLSGAIQGRPVLQGEISYAKRLFQALQRAQQVDVWAEEETAWHVHRFHSYTARTHPALVRTVLQNFLSDSPLPQVVLDPFVGSGTTLVEVGLRGGVGIGLDVNGFALQLARWKATPLSSSQRHRLVTIAEEIVARSRDRIRMRRMPQKKWDDPRWYEPHAYLELCGLREEIEWMGGEQTLQEGLLLAFSSLLVKSSRQQADSRVRMVRKHLAQGSITDWFSKRVQEMVRCQQYYAQQVPPGTPPPVLLEADARSGWGHRIQVPVDLVFTSPPYFGVYDYVSHQARHRAWMGSKDHTWKGKEMASRREKEQASPEKSWEKHGHDTQQWMKQMVGVLRPGGRAVILVGDGFGVQGVLQPGDAPIRQAARALGLLEVASCTVRRPSRITKTEGAQEHLLLFQRAAATDKQDGFLPEGRHTR